MEQEIKVCEYCRREIRDEDAVETIEYLSDPERKTSYFCCIAHKEAYPLMEEGKCETCDYLSDEDYNDEGEIIHVEPYCDHPDFDGFSLPDGMVSGDLGSWDKEWGKSKPCRHWWRYVKQS